MLRRIAVLGAATALLAAAYFAGFLDLLRDLERVRQLLTGSGALGPLVYVAVFALFQPLGVPGVLFVIPAVLAWPVWLAFLLCWAGATASGLVGFGFARWLARDWVAAHLPPRFRRLDERIGERELTTVILLRVFFFLAAPAHWALGLSRVRFAPALVGTAVGMVPGAALYTLAGKGLFEFFSTQPPAVWIGAGLLALAIGARVLWSRRRRAGAGGESAL